MEGLEGYDQSLYREWRLNNEEISGDGDKAPRLSYHSYSQDTMLLNHLASRVELLCQAFVRNEDGDPAIDPVFFQSPGETDPEPPQPQEATFETLSAFLA